MTTRVYVDQILTAGDRFRLPEDAAHHLSKVLRMRAADPVVLFNGDGAEFPGQLTSVGKREVIVELRERAEIDRESPLRVTLVQGISRGERMDYTIQKAVELGVAAIMPVTTSRSTVQLQGDRLHKRDHHWRKIIISACEQCGRNRLPELHTVGSLSDRLDEDRVGQKLVMHGEAGTSLVAMPFSGQAVTLLIGPEGGLSEAEILQSRDCGYTPVTLGPRVLRTETAALAAISTLQGLYGDFRS